MGKDGLEDVGVEIGYLGHRERLRERFIPSNQTRRYEAHR
jgi:hypothetical protein